VVGNVWVVKAGYGVIALALVSFGGGQLNNLLFVLLARHLFPPFRLQLRTPFNRVRGRELASYSFWSFLIDMANQLRFRVDSLTVGWLFGGVAITRYAIGARLIEYAQSPLVMISNTAMPALAKLHVADQQERTADIVIFLLRLSLLLSVYAGGIVFAVGRPFINRWIGPEHGGSHVIAMLLAVGFLTEVFLMPLTNWLYAAARHRMLAGANAAEAVVNIVLSIILGRQFGLVGVALGTVIPLLLMQLAWVAPHACRSLGLGSRRFLMLAKPGLTSILVVGSTGYLIQRIANANGYLGVVAAATIITAVYWPVVLFLCLGGQDRDFIWRALPLPAFARGFV
jgi:O-antigen/teichoic acid export membrane protein